MVFWILLTTKTRPHHQNPSPISYLPNRQEGS